MKSTDFTLRIKGKEFNDGYNLYYLSKSLINFHTLLEKSYLTIEDKKKMTEQDREKFQVRAYNIREGSFQSDFFIHLSTVAGSLIPLVTSMSPEAVWKLVTESFTYLNTVLAGNRNGMTYTLNADNGSNISVINGDGATIYQVHPDVLNYVNRTERNFENLTRLIDKNKGIESISVRNKEDDIQELYIGEEEKMNFENKRRLDPNPISFKGTIIKADGEGYNGKLRVIEGSEGIIPGEYPFEFLVKDDPDKLKSAFLNVKRFNALKETILHTSSLEQKIYKLKIIDAK